MMLTLSKRRLFAGRVREHGRERGYCQNKCYTKGVNCKCKWIASKCTQKSQTVSLKELLMVAVFFRCFSFHSGNIYIKRHDVQFNEPFFFSTFRFNQVSQSYHCHFFSFCFMAKSIWYFFLFFFFLLLFVFNA